MKILFVAMSNSIHTARWINQITGRGWDIRLFPSIDCGITHPQLKNVHVYHSFYGKQKNNKVVHHGYPVLSEKVANVGIKVLKKLYPTYRVNHLADVISSFDPDIIHCLEMQSAAYLTLDAKKKSSKKFPRWIVTNWGSDIYLFGQLPNHKQKIREVLSQCDFYSCECKRDVLLAKEFGFKGTVLPVLPNGGGYLLDKIVRMKQLDIPSKRKLIMVKGYQGWSGRALFALAALRRCTRQLQGYTILIYSSEEDSGIPLAAELFTQQTGIKTITLPKDTPYEEILSYHGRARISLGLSISDGISTSLLEAMIMGSFPIQSDTSCGNEWILDGKTGILVPPENIEKVARALSLALTNDELVDTSAKENAKVAQKRLRYAHIKKDVIKLYKLVAKIKHEK